MTEECTITLIGKLKGNPSTIKDLGQGEFGEVVLEQYTDTYTAVKNRKEEAGLSEFKIEIELMCLLQNNEPKLPEVNKNFIVEFYGCDNMEIPKNIYMEYCPALSLHNNIINKQFIGDFEFKKIVVHLARGMQYIHSFNIVHRDLAARNVLVCGPTNSDTSGNLQDLSNCDYKIADFGLAKQIRERDYFQLEGNEILPLQWLAPEVFRGRHYKETDVWSYACTLLEVLLLGSRPWGRISNTQVGDYLGHGHSPLNVHQNNELIRNLSPEIITFFQLLFVTDHNDRPTFSAILTLYSNSFIRTNNVEIYNTATIDSTTPPSNILVADVSPDEDTSNGFVGRNLSSLSAVSINNMFDVSEEEVLVYDEMDLQLEPVRISKFPRLRNFFKKIGNIFKKGKNKCFGSCIPRSEIYVAVYSQAQNRMQIRGGLYSSDIQLSNNSTIISSSSVGSNTILTLNNSNVFEQVDYNVGIVEINGAMVDEEIFEEGGLFTMENMVPGSLEGTNVAMFIQSDPIGEESPIYEIRGQTTGNQLVSQDSEGGPTYQQMVVSNQPIDLSSPSSAVGGLRNSSGFYSEVPRREDQSGSPIYAPPPITGAFFPRPPPVEYIMDPNGRPVLSLAAPSGPSGPLYVPIGSRPEYAPVNQQILLGGGINPEDIVSIRILSSNNIQPPSSNNIQPPTQSPTYSPIGTLSTPFNITSNRLENTVETVKEAYSNMLNAALALLKVIDEGIIYIGIRHDTLTEIADKYNNLTKLPLHLFKIFYHLANNPLLGDYKLLPNMKPENGGKYEEIFINQDFISCLSELQDGTTNKNFETIKFTNVESYLLNIISILDIIYIYFDIIYEKNTLLSLIDTMISFEYIDDLLRRLEILGKSLKEFDLVNFKEKLKESFTKVMGEYIKVRPVGKRTVGRNDVYLIIGETLEEENNINIIGLNNLTNNETKSASLPARLRTLSRHAITGVKKDGFSVVEYGAKFASYTDSNGKEKNIAFNGSNIARVKNTSLPTDGSAISLLYPNLGSIEQGGITYNGENKDDYELDLMVNQRIINHAIEGGGLPLPRNNLYSSIDPPRNDSGSSQGSYYSSNERSYEEVGGGISKMSGGASKKKHFNKLLGRSFIIDEILSNIKTLNPTDESNKKNIYKISKKEQKEIHKLIASNNRSINNYKSHYIKLLYNANKNYSLTHI